MNNFVCYKPVVLLKEVPSSASSVFILAQQNIKVSFYLDQFSSL